MRNMKYLVMRGSEAIGHEERIFLFNSQMSHAQMAEKLADTFWAPVRGGAVRLEYGKLWCDGSGAISLGLEGDRVKDSDLLNRQLDQEYGE